ncbi:hypothetical protein [Ekhidna sp.]|uniref:hypothetical protein n=1 Tax=Ekhidna sp. TaxID=2608089 RepID=UPI0032981CF1
MERKLHLRFLKVNLLLVLSIAGYGQVWHKISTSELKQGPSAYSTDFQGNLYLGFSDGRLTKYDPRGKVLENFSLSNNSSISLIDVQNNLKPFLFYFDNQQITILDRFASVPKDYRISDFELEIGMLACPAPDGDFWIVENNPQRLKKINPLRKITVLEVQVSLGDSISRMQAYQNILVIGDVNKLYILDQFGGILHVLKFEKLINFQIANGILYANTNWEIHEINPFKGIIISTLKKPDSGKMLKSKAGFISIAKKTLTFYRLERP